MGALISSLTKSFVSYASLRRTADADNRKRLMSCPDNCATTVLLYREPNSSIRNHAPSCRTKRLFSHAVSRQSIYSQGRSNSHVR